MNIKKVALKTVILTAGLLVAVRAAKSLIVELKNTSKV